MPILAKDEEKQRSIKEKALLDAASNNARAIGPSTPATASRGVAVAGNKMSKLGAPSIKNQAVASSSVAAVSGLDAHSTSNSGSGGSGTVKTSAGTAMFLASSTNANADEKSHVKSGNGSVTTLKKIPMVIQTIPPFRGGKGKTSGVSASANTSLTNETGSSGTTTNGGLAKATSPAAAGGVPSSPISATGNRLNVNASSFRPNPKANAFTPVMLVFFFFPSFIYIYIELNCLLTDFPSPEFCWGFIIMFFRLLHLRNRLLLLLVLFLRQSPRNRCV